jgi:hypothetical protein
MAIGEMVDVDATDLSQYGLAEPSLEFWYKYAEDEIHLLFGDQDGEGNIYVKHFDKNQVFLMDYASMSALYEVNPLSIVDKFIALVDIMKCDYFNVEHFTDPARNFLFEMNHETLPPEEGEEEGEEIMTPKVNGLDVDEDTFKEVYRYLIGLTIDKELEEYTPTGDMLFSATYTMNTGEPPIVISFYEYDTHFYVVQKVGEDHLFVTNKQAVDLFFGEAAKLASG